MKRGFSKGLVVGMISGVVLAGGTAMASSKYVQAALGQSVMLLNGSKVSSAPKLVYGGTTYVQLYSIQQALKHAGFGATWNGSKNPGVFSMTSPSASTSGAPTGSSSTTGTTNTSSAIGISQLPYSYTSPNGMKMTVNSITSTLNGLTFNITMQNNGVSDGDSMTTTWNVMASSNKLANVNQDQVFYDNFLSLHPGQIITGNTTFAPVPSGVNEITLYFTAEEGINFDRQHVTFDLTK